MLLEYKFIIFVAVITQKYVDAVNDPGLTAALEEVKIRVADKTSSDDE